ncbi:MAG: universal stress protein [Nitrospiraceae bacterium]|nr:universal stress protein [Nitrospiraceae bacterium]
MKEIKRMLLISRMERDSPKVFHYAVSLCHKLEAELFVMHSVHNPFGGEGWNLPVPNLEEEYKKLLADTRKKLEAMIAGEKQNGMKITEIIATGEPTHDILKTIKEQQIDLLVMAAHSEGKLEHMLFGRSQEEIIRRLPCSLMLVKSEPGPVGY